MIACSNPHICKKPSAQTDYFLRFKDLHPHGHFTPLYLFLYTIMPFKCGAAQAFQVHSLFCVVLRYECCCFFQRFKDMDLVPQYPPTLLKLPGGHDLNALSLLVMVLVEALQFLLFNISTADTSDASSSMCWIKYV